jgi:hypothetical protein
MGRVLVGFLTLAVKIGFDYRSIVFDIITPIVIGVILFNNEDRFRLLILFILVRNLVFKGAKPYLINRLCKRGNSRILPKIAVLRGNGSQQGISQANH